VTLGDADDPAVCVIDDDDEMRASLQLLLESVGYRVSCHRRATDFLDTAAHDASGCVIADVRMPGMDGLALLRGMRSAEVALPVILVSGYADVALGVAAMREGAYGFLTKPFREQEMLDTVAAAVALERSTREATARDRAMRAAFATLDPRERAIMTHVANGSRNKVIAARLGLSEITIKVARARVLAKMGVDSAAQLARIAERLGIE
jgi:FixJ family two-component response regulator